MKGGQRSIFSVYKTVCALKQRISVLSGLHWTGFALNFPSGPTIYQHLTGSPILLQRVSFQKKVKENIKCYPYFKFYAKLEMKYSSEFLSLNSLIW